MAKKNQIKRPKNLDDALKQVRDKRGLQIGSLSEIAPKVSGLSTGNLLIDQITGVGGFPRGRITESYGPPSSGKTTTALQAAALVQQAGGVVAFFDYEFALDPAYCAALGLDLEDESFLYAMPDTFEQGINALRELVVTGAVDIAIVDSVAAMSTEAEVNGEVKRTFSDKALLMSMAMRQLTGDVFRSNTSVVFLNHVKDVIDQSPMGQKLQAQGIKRKTTPGGEALKFHASLRLSYKQIGNIRAKEHDEITNATVDVPAQTKVIVKVEKNKVARPFRSAEVRVRFGHGFSQAHAAYTVLCDYGVIKKKTGGIHPLDEQIAPEGWDFERDGDHIRGEENFLRELEERPEWLDRMAHWAQELMREAVEAQNERPSDEPDGVGVQFDEETGEIVG